MIEFIDFQLLRAGGLITLHCHFLCIVSSSIPD